MIFLMMIGLGRRVAWLTAMIAARMICRSIKCQMNKMRELSLMWRKTSKGGERNWKNGKEFPPMKSKGKRGRESLIERVSEWVKLKKRGIKLTRDFIFNGSEWMTWLRKKEECLKFTNSTEECLISESDPIFILNVFFLPCCFRFSVFGSNRDHPSLLLLQLRFYFSISSSSLSTFLYSFFPHHHHHPL